MKSNSNDYMIISFIIRIPWSINVRLLFFSLKAFNQRTWNIYLYKRVLLLIFILLAARKRSINWKLLNRVCFSLLWRWVVRMYILHTFWCFISTRWKFNELQNGVRSTAHDQWVIFTTIKFVINGVLYVKYYTFHCLKMLT